VLKIIINNQVNSKFGEFDLATSLGFFLFGSNQVKRYSVYYIIFNMYLYKIIYILKS